MEESTKTKPSLQYFSHSNFHTPSSQPTRTPKYLKAYENHFGETTVCDDRRWGFGQFSCSNVRVQFQSINAVDDAAVCVAFTLRSLLAAIRC